MRIGIANSLNLEKRTGVEEYVYQILKHLPLVDDNKNHQLFLLAPFISNEVRNFAGYTPKVLKWPFKKFWTQIRLSWEMLKNPSPHQNFGVGDKLDVLFVPAHTFPFFSPKLVITIHGLEYENVPKMYSWFQRLKLKFFTKRNAKNAEKIIVPSQSVKDDLIKFYPAIFKKGGTSKIFVIHHGISSESGVMSNEQKNNKPYILYLGGKHKRKNIDGLKKAYEILKKKYKIKHDLILGGVNKYISEEEKWNLLKNADVFVYPSLCEGFGFPPLEAQCMGVPVVSSNVSAMPETLRDSALLVNPSNPEEIAEAIYKVLNDEQLKNELIKRGQENVKRFSWPKCAKETLKVITL